MILLLIRNEAIYHRIAQTIEASHVAPFMPDLATLQTWLSDNPVPLAALLDPQWPRVREAEPMLQRMGVPISPFTGTFADAEAWLRDQVATMESHVENEGEGGIATLTSPVAEEDDSPSITRHVVDRHENPLLKKRPARVRVETSSLGPESQETSQPPSEEPHSSESSAPPQIIERIIEREVEKPVYIREERPTTLRSRLILVVGIWPRAGVSTVAYTLSHLFAKRLSPGAVTCIEHPCEWPRMWNYFQCDEYVKRYRHWLQDGIGQAVDIQGVSLVPLAPDFEGESVPEERLVEFVYRQMRRPITIVDCGQTSDESLLFSMADQIVCVLDCDPTFLSIASLGTAYQHLIEEHGERVVTVLNKWTRYAQYNDPSSKTTYFADAVKVPYLSSNITERALWEGAFISSYSDLDEELVSLTNRLVTPFVPDSLLEPQAKERKRSLFNRRRLSR